MTSRSYISHQLEDLWLQDSKIKVFFIFFTQKSAKTNNKTYENSKSIFDDTIGTRESSRGDCLKEVAEDKAAPAGPWGASHPSPHPTSDFSHSSTLPVLGASYAERATCIFSFCARDSLGLWKLPIHVHVKVYFGGGEVASLSTKREANSK